MNRLQNWGNKWAGQFTKKWLRKSWAPKTNEQFNWKFQSQEQSKITLRGLLLKYKWVRVKCFLKLLSWCWCNVFVYVSGSKTVQRCPNTHPFAYNNGANCCEVPLNQSGKGPIFYNINLCYSKYGIVCPKQPCYTLEPMVGYQWYQRPRE